MKRPIISAFVFITLLGFGQNEAHMVRYGELIKPEELKDNLTIVASDALEGRLTGTRGQKMAAAFIANHFREVGLVAPVNGSYYQPVPLYNVKMGDVYVAVAGQTLKNYTDFFYYGDEPTEGEIKSDIVFIGQARDEDFAQVNVKGKAVLVVIKELTLSGIQIVEAIDEKARAKGAKNVFVTAPGRDAVFETTAKLLQSYLSDGEMTLVKPGISQGAGGLYFVKSEIAAKIFSTTAEKLFAAANSHAKKNPLKKIKPGTVSVQVSLDISEVSTENVLGYLPGTDKKDELVVITAHFDHIGKRSSGSGDLISNGADDDGSGTVAVMQLAKAFAEAKKNGHGPRRSILFMTVTGEEEGLFGSEYYVSSPVFPLANTVVNLNMDMIGRTDSKYAANKNYIYVIGADKLSSELHAINERLNTAHTKLKFDYVYNDEAHPDRLYYRSDHWNFAQKNIPIIFYFDGIHEDYHKVSDEVDKIDFDLLALRARCAFNTAWEVANRDERLRIDKR